MPKDIEITEAPEAQRFGTALIAAYHPHLAETAIRYLLTSQVRKRKGAVILADTRKLNPLDRYFISAGEDVAEEFLILIGRESWYVLSEAQRIALIDHELNHLGVSPDDDETVVLVGHDVEEFGAVIARHGLWMPAVERFVAVGQAKLPGFELAHEHEATTLPDRVVAAAAALFSNPAVQVAVTPV